MVGETNLDGAAMSDVIVIGGGIAGASVAAALAEQANVTLLEAEESTGYHTSGRSAATFIENYGAESVRRLSRASKRFFESPPDYFNDQPLLADRGVMYVAEASELPQLKEIMQAGSGLEWLTAEQCAERIPVLADGPVAAGIWEADARDIDVDLFLQQSMRQFRRLGGQLVCKARVAAASHRDGVWRVDTPAGTFAAPAVVNAAGAWGDVVGRLFGAEPLGLTPMRRSIGVVAVEGSHPVRADGPLLAGAAGNWYCKPQGEWLLVSPADETPSEPCDAWPEDLDLAEGVERMQHATGYTVTRMHRSWAGLRTFSPDRCLVAGFDPQIAGFFWLVGQGGYGFQTAPAMARAASSLILGNAFDAELVLNGVDSTMLDPGRFA
jgi:D-arginine dehydrogenase